MHPVIILPTYNEKENLAGIVQEIFSVGVRGLRIIIVDDNSPDGTGVIADDLARKNENIKVLHRAHKQGLGMAYIDGFKQALKDPEAQYIFEMDADFSHQPKYLPVFLREIKDFDLVLGSRYISGGGVENWGALRRFISWLANTVIRIILGVRIKDLTGGFKCLSRTTIEKLNLQGVESRGYNFQIEITYKAIKQGMKVKEIPITFVERRAGYSKFSASIMFESFWKVIKLRFSR